MSTPEDFITRWQSSGAAERSNYALFLSELCDLLEVPRPDPSSEHNKRNDYVIDRAFTRSDKDGKSSTVYLDLYKRGHFVLETKQGSSGGGDKLGHGKRGTKGWDKALDKAYNQARGYIRDLPADHGRPPFLIVADVGHCFDLYAEFTGTGGTYLAFPNPATRRIFLEDLRDPETRDLLRTIWTDPHALDPSKHAAKVTREVATTLAKLAASLEKDGHDPQVIATFLQRLLFTLFAEDVGLLPGKAFEQLLEKTASNPAGFAPLITALWQDMATGSEFSTVLMQEVIHFNGGLFVNPTALPLQKGQIDLLVEAARQDWKEVEPAIFGTLVERALDPRERHKLGAHYTPRSYVERLVEPTLMKPLREKWQSVKGAAILLYDQEKPEKAREEIEKFHRYLCRIKILDPACGSGNFLYVALARIKELEAEVLDLLDEFGGDRSFELDSFKVRPSQFLGIEINPRAAAIAQLVLWIGYFQWQLKTTGKADTNDRPLLRSENTIECRDAVLDYDEKIPRRDPETGEYLTIWDGRTTKPHPVTGKEVPDESARKPLYDYTNPRRTEWPEADYIVGNPPFLGNKRMRDGLGDGYVEALRKAWKKEKSDSWDFVMFWWHQAAELLRAEKSKAFGLITTNSIHQTFNRRCLEVFLANDKKPISITFAVPDHPWVDSADGAAVRIAMTTATTGRHEGQLLKVVDEKDLDDGEIFISASKEDGKLSAKLTIGADLTSSTPLRANRGLCNQGVKLVGEGFLIRLEEQYKFALGDPSIFKYISARDLLQKHRSNWVIDFFGFDVSQAEKINPKAFQKVLTEVKPLRDQNREKSRKANWWLFGRSNENLRNSIENNNRIILIPQVSKFRVFAFESSNTVVDASLYVAAFDEAEMLSILQSQLHIFWSLAAGGTLEDRPTYTNKNCFETFPFPDLDDRPDLRDRLRDLGEKLDAHRKARQAEHSDLTLTGIYNVLEKLRQEEPLTDKEKLIHDHGLVTLLKQIHDEIDAAVLEAYRWEDLATSTPLADRLARGDEELEQAILQRLIDLNHERAAEEAAGKIRYLRPDFQDPEGTQAEAKDQDLDLPEAKAAVATAKVGKPKWPKALPERFSVIQDLLPETGPDPAALDRVFGRASKKRQSEINQILETLQALGQI